MAENTTHVSMGSVTQADLQSDEAARERAFQEFLQGSPFGPPTRDQQVGLSSVHPDHMPEPEPTPSVDQQIAAAEQRLAELTAPIQPQQTTDYAREAAEWKKKYGDRENEYGVQRRELEETISLLLQQQSMATQPNNFTAPNYNVPNYSTPSQPPVPPFDPFQGVGDDEFLPAGKVKQLVREFIGPVLGATWQKAEAAERELAQVKVASFNESKRAAGITPLDELKLKAKYPYLTSMPDTPDKVTLMRGLIPPKQEQPQPQPTLAPQVQVTTPRGAEVVRTLTHIEGNRGASGEPNTNPNAAFQAEMAAAERLPFHLRAAAMQAVMNKYKVPTVNTFGSGRYRV